jgi:hypothetical protein
MHDTPATETMMNKLPAVTLVFWLIKILSTTAGETGADFLIFKLHVGLSVTTLIMGALLIMVMVMVIQLRKIRYEPWAYWLCVVQVSIFGTLLTDSLVDTYGVALTTTSVFFSIARTHIRPLVCLRAQPVDSTHLPWTPRILLLAGDSHDVCPRHSGWGLGRGRNALGLFRICAAVPGGYWAGRSGALRVQARCCA